MAKLLFIALVLASPLATQAIEDQEASALTRNPIRRVVTMLEAMVKKVAMEGDKEAKMYEQYMCYCNDGGASLGKAIAAARAKIPQVESAIKLAESEKEEVTTDLKVHHTDRDNTKSAVTEAEAVRTKDAAQFAMDEAALKSNLAAIDGAVMSLNKGTGKSFVQTGAAQVLKKAVSEFDMVDADRQDVLSFLTGSHAGSYVPQSGEIIGILKQIHDSMSQRLAEKTSDESTAIQQHIDLMVSKKREIEALTESIETKTERKGDLAVRLTQMKDDLEDTKNGLAENEKFLANLDQDCALKRQHRQEREKTRSEEVAALSETIKLLSDDDALELFKKTLPTAGSSFLQTRGTARALADKARRAVRSVRSRSSSIGLDFIALALQGRTSGFAEVSHMIDNMAQALRDEQSADDKKKEDCKRQLDTADDEKKSFERATSDLQAITEEAKQTLDTTMEDITALEHGIAALDKSVKDATETRKQEHADYTDLMASNSAAEELINFAKNRLNKFYNPKLYKEAKKEELSKEGRIFDNHMSFLQVGKNAPDAPDAPVGTYEKKAEESSGVIAMMNLLLTEVDKEMAEAKTDEKDSQADFETMLRDAKEKRAQDARELVEKQATKASLESKLEAHAESARSLQSNLDATLMHIRSLHADCDWLLQNHDTRKEARASEIDALHKAKAVLNGADYA
eukprot:NODE_2641_length_2174_cov_8.311676.p1 GENE.NODE_2641_length_2174_cov_8.311676~~NODE_2641_length_2174_cov_8.311676.p1  ORF type:complete len:685 (+),score=266.96 NODE_2641_length_2174_cov_8.311676:73-2127(+)